MNGRSEFAAEQKTDCGEKGTGGHRAQWDHVHDARVRRVRRGARVRAPSDAVAAEQARAGRVSGLGSAGSVHVQEEL